VTQTALLDIEFMPHPGPPNYQPLIDLLRQKKVIVKFGKEASAAGLSILINAIRSYSCWRSDLHDAADAERRNKL